ncbi:Sperm flagellar protein 2 Protein KPL2 [Channa argus]|uniref:Sperm flagellar protein 2 Protein KPL2 n=1 Tax=Channa argus TaxID=215402 RepID=A0A6G1Q039_CHAAH|nr:Sperm flagellar protein 2 Protein KPL2 [Channa argus]
MSEILCRWLNQELRLSKTVEPKTFAKDFSSGYLFGEVLHKYELQNDFSMFMKKDTAISKLNNFTRLEPTLQLLGISFSINTAQELMQEKQGVATRLLYQLYVSLEKKKRSDISGTMMEMMQPAANAALHRKQYEIYSDRLHQVVKRDAELKLQKISQHYEKKFQQLSDRSSITYPIRQPKIQDEKRRRNIEKLQVSHLKYSGIMPLNQACIVKVPKPPYYTLQLNLKKRLQNQRRRQQAAQNVQTDIAQFEINKKKLVTTGFPSSSSSQSFEVPGSVTKVILKSNSEYIQEIRQRLEENAIAREQREKRRDRFLVEQLKAHEAQEVKLFSLKNVDISDVDIIIKAHTDMSKEAQREEQLVKRLTRQTQQEKRLAVQLLQIRMQKEVIRENRLFRELQYQQRRERDIQEALEREATLAQQAKLDHAEEIRKELEFLNRIAAERSQLRYQKHFKICKDILGQLVDLATKAGEYRLLSENLIPQKLMREWKELLFRGLPLYEPTKGLQPTIEFSGPLDPVECEKQEILNNQDYDEYTAMQGNAVEEVLKKGKIIPNKLLLDIIIEAIRQVPAQAGWILDGFPEDITQAYLLEKGLGGSVDVENEVENSRANLAADPNPPRPPPPPAPVLDLVLLLDIPDDSVKLTIQLHILSLCASLIPKHAETDTTANSHTTDQSLYLAQIPHRINAFRDTWPKLEKWFGGKQNILVHADASVDEEELYKRVDSVLQQMLLKGQKDPFHSGKDEVSSSSAAQPLVDPPLSLTEEAADQTESNAILSSSNWVYVDEPLPKEIPEFLCTFWETMCISYVNNVKTVMQQLRSQHAVVKHLFHIREGFKQYLGRPDLKQELVSQWQKDFNSKPDDMREDEDTKAELHLRLDVSAGAHQGETNEYDASDEPNGKNPEVKSSQIKHIHQEYAAVVSHEVNAAKVRIAMVKGHGLILVNSLKSRAEQTLSNLQKWLETQYLAEMKSVDQLCEVVCHHIEAGSKLQYELVLESTDFYLNGDCHMVASPAPPPRPPPMERPTQSTLTIAQLESLYQQLRNIAPSELLVVLQCFKAADPNSTGYINEQQYLQTELWFSSESAQPSPEDPSEPLPYDRLANLHKFFFQLFADHFFSPPQLDYVSMLQYFAADPNPREGFIRALSVVLGQNLELSTAGQLVKSMPSIEAAAELSFSEIDMEYKKEEALCTSGSSSAEPEVSIPALFAVICHKATKRNLLPPGSLSEQHLVHIFKELGFKPEDCVPFSVISPHPFMQCIMESSTHYQLVCSLGDNPEEHTTYCDQSQII